MSYSIIGILAILIHLIINRDVLWYKGKEGVLPAQREYRIFIYGILIFCVTDVCWGLLSEARLIRPLYAMTVLYFITMMLAFLLWSHYVAAYLDGKRALRRVLLIACAILFTAELTILTVNFFVPIQFWYDEAGNYHAGAARYWTLLLQVVLYLLTSVYAYISKAKNPSAAKRLRRIIGLFGITMFALIIFQFFYPWLPLYSIGFLMNSCLLHSFVVEDEKEEYHKKIEEMLRLQQEQSEELGSAKRKIYTDPLTGVKSKQAYIDDTTLLYSLIREGHIKTFAVVVFDLNDLKQINDTLGHDTGDIYIYTASMLISEFFSHSPVYRIGGDEFASILEGEDYRDRAELLAAFDHQINKNMQSGRVVIASGMSDFDPKNDRDYRMVFERADQYMYQRKHTLKEMQKKYPASYSKASLHPIHQQEVTS